MNGGWDDLNLISLFVMPGVAALALFLALLNVMHYRGHGGYVLYAVSVLTMAVLLVIYVTLTMAFRVVV